jgi:hypothetical protein
MNEKVKLQKSVCDVLDEMLKKQNYTNQNVIEEYLNMKLNDVYLDEIRKIDFEILIRALVYGYEPELTAEEQIRAKYEYYNLNKTQYSYGYHKGVIDALQIHGIYYDWLEDDAE